MNTFLTIEQAVQITGKSVSTIRRVVSELKKSDPQGKYLTKEAGVTGDRWLIEKEYLFKKLRIKSGEQSKKPSNDRDELLKRLEDEVKFLRSQITQEKQEKAALLDRLKEAQENLKNQQALLLNEQKKRIG